MVSMETNENGLTLEQFRIAFSKALLEKHGFAHGDLTVLMDGMRVTALTWADSASPNTSARDYAEDLASMMR